MTTAETLSDKENSIPLLNPSVGKNKITEKILFLIQLNTKWY